jgi:hypothetical protein
MCDKLSIGAYLVGQVKKTLFFTFHFYDSAFLSSNPNYRFDTECVVSVDQQLINNSVIVESTDGMHFRMGHGFNMVN